MDAERITQILTDNDINSFMRNQLMSQIAPCQISSGGVDAAKVDVLVKDKEKALLSIDKFKNS